MFCCWVSYTPHIQPSFLCMLSFSLDPYPLWCVCTLVFLSRSNILHINGDIRLCNLFTFFGTANTWCVHSSCQLHLPPLLQFLFSVLLFWSFPCRIIIWTVFIFQLCIEEHIRNMCPRKLIRDTYYSYYFGNIAILGYKKAIPFKPSSCFVTCKW